MLGILILNTLCCQKATAAEIFSDLELKPATGQAAIASRPFRDFSELSLDDLLNQVVVTAARHERPLSSSPVTMHVITEEDIRRSPAMTLSDLLRQVPGFQTKTWLSEFTNTSLRGMVGASVINERIMWMLDGVPINDVRDGGIWTDITIPLSNIKRIEVLSGPGSALYGSNAFVGVVHIITKDPDDYLCKNQRGEVSSEWSTFDTTINNLTTVGTTGRTKWLWSADAASTEGPGLVRDQFRPNEDAHSQRQWGYLRGKYQWGNERLNLGLRQVAQDYDGFADAPTRLYKWKRGERWIDWHHTVPRSKKITDTLVVSWHGFSENFFNFADVPGLAYNVDSSRWHVNLQRDQKHDRHQLSYGTGLRSESYKGNDFYPDHQSILKNNLNLFFQDEVTLRPLWSLTLGGRYDTHPNYQNIFSPHLSLSRQFNDKKGRVRITTGSSFKEPSNWQSFIDQPSGMGNPNMEPERLTSAEISVEYQFPKELFCRSTFYSLEHKNIIWENYDVTVADLFYKNTYGIAGKFHPQQPGDSAKIQGCECELRKRFGQRTHIFANGVFLNAKDNQDRELQYDAKTKWSSGLWHSFDPKFGVSLETHFVGDTIDTAKRDVPGIGVRPVPSYQITGAALMFKLSREETLKISAWNLGHGTYEEMLGASVPATTYRFSYSRSF
ncbi:MAG: TonB-dependent receptor [Candidatus Ozemobacteraceae bacterium]